MFNQILVHQSQPKDSVNYGGGNHQSEKGMVHFRRKKKEILDLILEPLTYDRQIRPAGHINDTSGCCYSLFRFISTKCYELLHNKYKYKCL